MENTAGMYCFKDSYYYFNTDGISYKLKNPKWGVVTTGNTFGSFTGYYNVPLGGGYYTIHEDMKTH